MIKLVNFIILLIFLISVSFGQDHYKTRVDYWEFYMIDNTVIDSVQLKERLGNTLIIADKDSTYRLPLYRINKISRYVESKSEGKEILGILGGAFLGGCLGWLVAPKYKAFGHSNWAPQGKQYIAGGAIIGGLVGYFISKPGNKEVYQLSGLHWEKRITIIDSLVENKY